MPALSSLVKRQVRPTGLFATTTRNLSTHSPRLSLAARALGRSTPLCSLNFTSSRLSLAASASASAPLSRSYASMSAGAQVIDGNAVAL